MFLFCIWNVSFSSSTLFQTPSASLFILSSIYSIFSSWCLVFRGQIFGQYSFEIQRIAWFWTTCNFCICVLEQMFSETTGYVKIGSTSDLYSLTFNFLVRFLILFIFFSSAFALFTLFSTCLTKKLFLFIVKPRSLTSCE